MNTKLTISRNTLAFFLIFLFLSACTAIEQSRYQQARAACPVTIPEWVLAPEDDAVGGPAAEGYYYVNENRTIWGAAWWYEGWLNEDEEYSLVAGPDGTKTGWFRPADAEMTATGERIDGDAPPADFHFPCCYPTRFQASGLAFPTEGCWEVDVEAEGEMLTFVVWVEP